MKMMSARVHGLLRLAEGIENILIKLKEENDRGIPVIVEGRKDLEALNKLGITGRVIQLKSGRKSIFNRLEYDIANEEVIVFTDFDKRGTELARTVRNHFEKRGKKANMLLWKRMRRLASRSLKDVEGLPSYLAKLKELSEKATEKQAFQ